MKLLGLIGGMSWENTIEYYKIINKMVKERLGGWNSAKLLLYSVNFEDILRLEEQEKWGKLTEIFIPIASNLEAAGCKALILCSNTIHKIADDIEKAISIPIIHVVDATAENIKLRGINTIGLLGTKYTMEGGFYEERLRQKHGLNVLIPIKAQREYINNAIYQELASGKLLDSTKEEFLKIINQLKREGAEGIILGCTEIPMLIKEDDVELWLFNTLKIHLQSAVEFLLDNRKI
jgi:aspartate racemase